MSGQARDSGLGTGYAGPSRLFSARGGKGGSSSIPLTDQESFNQAMLSVFTVAELLAGYDFDAWLENERRSHIVAPILDPTLYMKALHNREKLEGCRRVVEASRDFVRAVNAARADAALPTKELWR